MIRFFYLKTCDTYFSNLDYKKNYMFFIQNYLKNGFDVDLNTVYKQPNWVEIWNIDIQLTNLENIEFSTWNLYLKYKLSMFKSWHILEERFMVIFLMLLFLFF